MVVKIQKKADTGSNKPGKYSVQLTAQAYAYTRPTGFNVAVLNPKIDRLSFTYNIVDIAARQKLVKNLNYLMLSESSPIHPWTKQKGWGSVKYSKSYGLDVGDFGKVLVQHAPLYSNNNFLRFEFGAPALKPTAIKIFKELLPNLSNGLLDYEHIAVNCKVTRLDVAVDLINIDLEDLLISTPKPGVSMGYFGLTGKAETKYLNVNTNGSNLYVYDRKTHIQKLQDKGVMVDAEYGETKYTRVEFRLYPDRPISKLNTLKHNPFKRINLIDIESPEPPEQEYHWKLFQDSCRYRGLNGAINHLPIGLKEQYSAVVHSTSGSLWKPQILWSSWPDTLSKIGFNP